MRTATLAAALMAAVLPNISASVSAQPRAEGVARAADGRIARSSSVRYQFRKANPCPSNASLRGPCAGYAIDHIVPLKRGGADAVSNLQWLTIGAWKEKTRWE
jgi:hypothetical protein